MKMIQNDLIASRETRATTEDEVEYLQHLLNAAPSPRKRVLKGALNFLVLWGFSLLGLLLASGLFNYLAKSNANITSALAFPYLKELLIVVTGLYALYSTNKWLSGWDNPYPNILLDMNARQVSDETYPVQAVCRLQEPEFGGFIYFLKISEQVVFVTYDYQSQHEPNSELVIKDKLILSRAPHCKNYTKQVYSGEQLFLSGTYPLILPPEKWPLPDSWLSLSWSQIVTIYSQK